MPQQLKLLSLRLLLDVFSFILIFMIYFKKIETQFNVWWVLKISFSVDLLKTAEPINDFQKNLLQYYKIYHIFPKLNSKTN